METIVKYLTDMDMDLMALLKTGGLLLLGTMLLSLFGRFLFGKKSALNTAVSSAIGILFLYVLSVIVNALHIPYASYIPPLPLVTISGDSLILFSFFDAHYTQICSQLLSTVILSFLVNIVDRWIPKGEKLISWILFRVLTVLIASVLHLVSTGLLAAYVPEGIATYAPTVLLGLLLLLLLTGALKVPVGALLSSVNPLIAALYTFFFANMIGKQITKAILTTAILSGLVILLQELGLGVLSIATGFLTAYLPFIIILVVLWFIVGRLL